MFKKTKNPECWRTLGFSISTVIGVTRTYGIFYQINSGNSNHERKVSQLAVHFNLDGVLCFRFVLSDYGCFSRYRSNEISMNKTGRVTNVIGYNGKSARVILDSARRVTVCTSHRPMIGDVVVEGELSRELVVKHGKE